MPVVSGSTDVVSGSTIDVDVLIVGIVVDGVRRVVIVRLVVVVVSVKQSFNSF